MKTTPGNWSGISVTGKNELLGDFINRVPISIAFFSTDGRLIKINDHFRQKLALGPDDLGEFTLRKFFREEEEKYHDALETSGQRVNYYCSDLKYKKATGELIWFKISLFLDGQIFKRHDILVLVAQDMTKTKLEQRKSHEKEVLLHSINENTSEGIYRRQVGNGILYANKAFLNMFGYTPGELDEVDFSMLYAEEKTSKTLETKLVQLGLLRNEKILFRRKDGSQFWGLMNATRSTDEEGKEYYNGAIIDITEEKAKDDLLSQRNRELSKVNEQIDRFLYSASHDLRAPVSSMIGLIQLIDLEFGKDHKLVVQLEMLRECVVKLEGIIDGINSYSLNSRKRRPSEPFDVEQCLGEVIDELRTLENFDKISFVINHHCELPFYSDKERIKVVLKNVVSNAIVYQDPGKKINFIRIETHCSSQKMTVEISDNGIGIAQPYLDKVFGMFYRATTEPEGTGMGLYIAKEAMWHIEGTIRLDSVLNQGTVVSIEIPNDSKGKRMAKQLLTENQGKKRV